MKRRAKSTPKTLVEMVRKRDKDLSVLSGRQADHPHHIIPRSVASEAWVDDIHNIALLTADEHNDEATTPRIQRLILWRLADRHPDYVLWYAQHREFASLMKLGDEDD